MADTQNSVKTVRGNPDKTKPYRFKPGQCGNPGGRPKAILTDALRKRLESDPKLLQSVINGMCKRLKAGDVKAFAVARDGLEGKPIQQVQVGGEMQVSVTVDL